MRFHVNDRVKVHFRDEMVCGIVAAIDDYSLLIKGDDGKTNFSLPKDVGNYVEIVDEAVKNE